MIPDYHLKTFHPLCYSCDSESCLVGLTLCDPLDYKVHGNLQTRILEWVAFPFYRGSSQPRDWLQISRIVDRFFIPAEPQGKPKNTGVGRLSLLQWIFPSQESIRGLLHSLPTELSGKPFLFLELSEERGMWKCSRLMLQFSADRGEHEASLWFSILVLKEKVWTTKLSHF